MSCWTGVPRAEGGEVGSEVRVVFSLTPGAMLFSRQDRGKRKYRAVAGDLAEALGEATPNGGAKSP